MTASASQSAWDLLLDSDHTVDAVAVRTARAVNGVARTVTRALRDADLTTPVPATAVLVGRVLSPDQIEAWELLAGCDPDTRAAVGFATRAGATPSLAAWTRACAAVDHVTRPPAPVVPLRRRPTVPPGTAAA